jgi:hypothetical protein
MYGKRTEIDVPNIEPTDPELADRHIAALDFEFAKADVLERLRFQASFAEVGWRSLALINGGAIVGLFTFIGNAKPATNPSLLWTAFALFAAGLVMNILSIMGGFLAQAFYMKATTSTAWNKQAQMHGHQPQYVDELRAEMRAGNIWEMIAIAASMLSLAAFIGGAAFSLVAVTPSAS